MKQTFAASLRHCVRSYVRTINGRENAAPWSAISAVGAAQTIYRQRNVIERMLCHLKDWHRIATHFDRNIKSCMGAIALAAAAIW